jgi:hypothetical protein
MQALSNFFNQKYSTLNWLEFSLIALSCILLGIWAAANTIALRNILLVFGALISIVYFYQLHRQGQLKQYFGWRNSIPLFCIIGLFLWVLAHCFLFPTDYLAQVNELQSTWLRSALAAAIGVSAGIAIARNPSKIYWLWIGMIFCFIYLLGQYLNDVWYMHKLFTEHYMQYIFLGKVNGVLMGSILVSGILGTSLSPVYQESKHKIVLAIIGIFSIALVLFSYLYILEARNGFLIAVFLVGVWIFFELKKIAQESKQNNARSYKSVLAIILLIIIAVFALVKHIERTPQWLNLIEDIAISSQVDQYSTWQHAEDMGPPQAPSGRYISANTYLRAAWFTVGLKLIPNNLLGHGLLHESFQRALDKSRYLGAEVKSTHSAVLDFYFSFGLVGLFLLMAVFFSTIKAGRKDSPLRMIIIFNIMAIISIGLVTENTRQHSYEIIFFIVSLAALMASVSCQLFLNDLITKKI